MKKIEKRTEINLLDPVNLYLEDIKEIEEIISENYKFRLKDDAYEYESIDELIKNREGPIHELDFEGLSKQKAFNYEIVSINVRIRKFGAGIKSDDQSTITLGMVARIERILQKRTLRKVFSNSSSRGSLIAILYFILLILLLVVTTESVMENGQKIRKPNMLVMYSSLSILVIGILWYVLDSVRNSKVYLINRKDKKNFFVRNKDQILLALVSGIIGGLIGYFINYLNNI